jgi:hypothetical protein
MTDEVVRVTIGPDGKVAVEVEGMPGGRCLDETADLIDALGGDIEAREMTAEAYIDTGDNQGTEGRQGIGR